MKIKKLIKNIKKKLIQSCKYEHEAEQQAWWLIEKLTKKKQVQLLLQENINLNINKKKIFNNWLKKIINNNEPIQYILEEIPFCNIKIKVKFPILIPRPETEELTNWLINKLKKVKNNQVNILDIGTGSGCIAITIAKNFPNFKVTGIDINPQAIKLAQKNAILNKTKNIKFIISDFYKNLNAKSKFNLIVSNPPYISKNDWFQLDSKITKWEDKKALIANANGYKSFEIILKNAKKFLIQNEEIQKLSIPQIVLEFGKGQEDKLKTLFEKNAFKKIEIFKDFAGIKRWITAIL